ncbi:MAG: hypothetical protein NUK65_05315 [Firmicutes bacterium]|nr:hypothetical protein [Bacillota bacterium]
MLFNVAAEMVEKLEQEFREADPHEKERFVKCSLSLLQQIMGDSKDLVKG